MRKSIHTKVFVRPNMCMHENHVAMPCDTKWAVDIYDGRGKWMGTSLFPIKFDALKDAKRMRKENRG